MKEIYQQLIRDVYYSKSMYDMFKEQTPEIKAYNKLYPNMWKFVEHYTTKIKIGGLNE